MNKPQKKQAVRVNRELFMLWARGELLHFEKGRGYVADLAQHDEAKKALDAGETIHLTDKNGNVITTMTLEDGEYLEREA